MGISFEGSRHQAWTAWTYILYGFTRARDKYKQHQSSFTLFYCSWGKDNIPVHPETQTMANEKLSKARKAKNDEFYTQFTDIAREIESYLEYNPDTFRDKVVLLPCDDPEWSNFTLFFAQNFDRLGLRKLISTSYAYESKRLQMPYQPTLFESESLQFDITKSSTRGKIFTLSQDISGDGKIDYKDLQWQYLNGDGDFRSEEVTMLREEADIIVTNPPFSLFREFFDWVITSKKQFLMICNKNCITYKEVFPSIVKNHIWSGVTKWSGGLWFETKSDEDVDKVIGGVNMKNIPAVWFTNIDHGRRHRPLQLMTMKENLKYSRHKDIRENGYPKYDNYNAIEVAYTDAIPDDYDGVMGVPISFLEKHCPEQFEIVGVTENADYLKPYYIGGNEKYDRPYINGKRMYSRLLIHKTSK